MATFPSEFQRIFDEATTSNTALAASINAQPDFWLKNLKDLQEAYNDLVTKNNEVVATNATLIVKINALEGVDKEIANACESATAAHNALNQAVGAQTVYKDQNAKLTRQLQLAQSSNSNLIAPVPQARLSPKHPNPEKFSGDRDKLKAWIIQINTKMTRNANHFVFASQDTTQNKMFYVLSRLEGDAVGHIQPYVAEDMS